MDVISWAIQLLGLVLLIAGFRGNKRGMLLGAALLLWFGAISPEFGHGFMDGTHDATREVSRG